MVDDELPWTVEKRVGSVVEIFVRTLDTTTEVRRFSQAIYDTAVKTPGALLIVDLRTPVVFSDEVASAVMDLMVRANSVRKKTAILLSNQRAIFGLQLGRLVKDVGARERQTFTDTAALLKWLGKDLSPVEKDRVRAFLNPTLRNASPAAPLG
jgi:hypothetical protein